MSSPLFVKNSITIKASPAQVWDALVNPAQTVKYMFGCVPVTNWKPGGEILWKGEMEGKEMIFVKGSIVSITPEKHLAYTTIDPHSPIPDIPENYLTVTYALAPVKDGTELTVTQGDYTNVADGDKRYGDTIAEGAGVQFWNRSRRCWSNSHGRSM